MVEHVKVYADASGEWRWSAVTKGRTVADSGEGYENKLHAIRMATDLFPGASVTVESQEANE